MMGEPELVAEMEKEELGTLISSEGLEQLQNKYVQSVRVRVHSVQAEISTVCTNHVQSAVKCKGA